MNPTTEELAALVEKKLDCLTNIMPSKCLVDMQLVYAGDRGSTQERAVLYRMWQEDPLGFVKEMNSQEREFKRAIAALAKGGDKVRPTSGEMESAGIEDDDGGIEQVEEWLKLWQEERQQ